MSRHHDAAAWASHTKSHRARIRGAGRVQVCAQSTHVPTCPGMLDLDVDLWDVAHMHDLMDRGPIADVGPAFRACNRSAGGKRGAQLTTAARRDVARVRAW